MYLDHSLVLYVSTNKMDTASIDCRHRMRFAKIRAHSLLFFHSFFVGQPTNGVEKINISLSCLVYLA